MNVAAFDPCIARRDAQLFEEFERPHDPTMIRISNILSTSDVAEIFSQPVWRIRRLYECGTLPEPERIGTARMISANTLPEIAAALREKGWISEAEVAEA